MHQELSALLAALEDQVASYSNSPANHREYYQRYEEALQRVFESHNSPFDEGILEEWLLTYVYWKQQEYRLEQTLAGNYPSVSVTSQSTN